jgi:hypothetical protein
MGPGAAGAAADTLSAVSGGYANGGVDCEPSLHRAIRSRSADRLTRSGDVLFRALSVPQLPPSLLPAVHPVMKRALLLACALGAMVSSVAGVSPTVQTPTAGTFSGVFENSNNDVIIYKGIPFAQPPVGNLRWKSPQPLPTTSEVFAATGFKPMCFQPMAAPPNFRGSEDCLYLNVYTPADANPNSKYPVYVYIHGGGFLSGSAEGNPGSNFVRASGKAIVVTISYRVGILGFLALPALSNEYPAGEIARSGNYGQSSWSGVRRDPLVAWAGSSQIAPACLSLVQVSRISVPPSSGSRPTSARSAVTRIR